MRDILSLEMVTRFEAEESPVLPDTQEAAIRYHHDLIIIIIIMA